MEGALCLHIELLFIHLSYAIKLKSFFTLFVKTYNQVGLNKKLHCSHLYMQEINEIQATSYDNDV